MGAIASILLSPVEVCWWAQPAMTQPSTNPRSFLTGAEDMCDLTDLGASF